MSFLGIHSKTKLQEMKVKDLIDNYWKLINKQLLEEKFNEKTTILKYTPIAKELKEKIVKMDNNPNINTLDLTEEP